MDRHLPERGMLEAQVDLGFPRCGGVALGMGAVGYVEHPRSGNDHHAMPCEAVAPAEVDVVAGARERGVEPLQELPNVPADQHAGRVYCKSVSAAVVLALVQFVG